MDAIKHLSLSFTNYNMVMHRQLARKQTFDQSEPFDILALVSSTSEATVRCFNMSFESCSKLNDKVSFTVVVSRGETMDFKRSWWMNVVLHVISFSRL